MIDYHCHILPGIDDGAETIEESVAMARLLKAAGYGTVYCTPHMIKHFYDANNDTVKGLIKEVQDALNREKIELKLLYGREYMLDDSFHEITSALTPLENTNYVLVEFTPDVYQGMVRDSIAAIIRKGLTPMIAHPERYHLFQAKKKVEPAQKKQSFFERLFIPKPTVENKPAIESPSTGKELLEWLVGMQCAFQANLPSFKGIHGKQIQAAAQQLKELGIYTHTGTDAHSPEYLEKLFGLSAPLLHG